MVIKKGYNALLVQEIMAYFFGIGCPEGIEPASQKEIETFLEDYVYYALLMITLYEVNADKKALEKSIKIMSDTWELFFNKETQLFQKNIIKDNDLFASPVDLNDSNIPNGNSVYLLISNKLYSIIINLKVHCY